MGRIDGAWTEEKAKTGHHALAQAFCGRNACQPEGGGEARRSHSQRTCAKSAEASGSEKQPLSTILLNNSPPDNLQQEKTGTHTRRRLLTTACLASSSGSCRGDGRNCGSTHNSMTMYVCAVVVTTSLSVTMYGWRSFLKIRIYGAVQEPGQIVGWRERKMGARGGRGGLSTANRRGGRRLGCTSVSRASKFSSSVNESFSTTFTAYAAFSALCNALHTTEKRPLPHNRGGALSPQEQRGRLG